MKKHVLEFEKPIMHLNDKILELHKVETDPLIDISTEIGQLEAKKEELIKNIYSKLTPWQIVQVARHLNRPRTLDYINGLFTDFIELHGDRHYADDKSIIGGIAKFMHYSVVIIGHQKGRDTKENIERNFGMPRPEGYRKALKLMKLAEKFQLPLITFVDTNGAYPGIGAEERNQSEAIGQNLLVLSQLKTPIIVNIIGEGGSGGALAIAIGDQINMLEYAIYSVISPEGCASILWKDATKASDAAKILGITANKLKSLNLIDTIVNEPKGAAHNNQIDMMNRMKKHLKDNLKKLHEVPITELVEKRFERIMSYGQFTDDEVVTE